MMLMKKGLSVFWICVALITVLSMAQAEEDGPVLDFDVDTVRWKNRILFLFSPTESDPSFRLQKQDLAAGSTEVAERDLMILEILEQGKSRSLDGILSEKAVQRIHNRFGVPSGRYYVLLIGKDGGVKLRSEKPVSTEEIFGLIDSMPMRRQEMDRRRN